MVVRRKPAAVPPAEHLRAQFFGERALFALRNSSTALRKPSASSASSTAGSAMNAPSAPNAPSAESTCRCGLKLARSPIDADAKGEYAGVGIVYEVQSMVPEYSPDNGGIVPVKESSI